MAQHGANSQLENATGEEAWKAQLKLGLISLSEGYNRTLREKRSEVFMSVYWQTFMLITCSH